MYAIKYFIIILLIIHQFCQEFKGLTAKKKDSKNNYFTCHAKKSYFLKSNVLLSSTPSIAYDELPRTNEKSASIKGSAFH